MTWVDIGYVAKRRATRAGWVSPWPDHPRAGFPCHPPVEVIDLWWEPVVAALPAAFVRLGWDAVVGGNGHGFGCSPLSCNSGGEPRDAPHVHGARAVRE